MNKFFKIVNKVYESLVPDDETQRRIVQRYMDMHNIKTR